MLILSLGYMYVYMDAISYSHGKRTFFPLVMGVFLQYYIKRQDKSDTFVYNKRYQIQMEREKMEIAKTLLECLEMIEDPRASYNRHPYPLR